MENEVMKVVLNEVLSEQKLITGQFNNLQNNQAEILLAVQNLEYKMNQLKSTLSNVDNQSVNQQLADGLKDIKEKIADQPKEVVQEKRYLFFPDHNAREYYGVIFRWLLYIVIATYAFWTVKFLIVSFVK